MCYDCRMKTVASRELRNNTRRILDRVEAGEELTITVDGRPAARITGVTPHRQRWVARDVLFGALATVQADAALARELDELAPETTDDFDPL